MSDDVLERALEAERAATAELASIPRWLWDGSALPVPIETLADSHYGLLVQEHADLRALAGLAGEAHVSGLLMPHSREIWIDANEAGRAPNRRRFTIGHELGHWVLHCSAGGSSGPIHCREGTVQEEGAVAEHEGANHLADLAEYPPRELEANQFGAALLMPTQLLRAFRRETSDAASLAALFSVSVVAMEKRLWFIDRLAS